MADRILTKWQNRLLYAGVAGGVLMVYKILMIVFFGSAKMNPAMSYLDLIFVASLLFVAISKSTVRYREETLDGFISYSKCFVHGFFVCLIACVLRDLPTWVYNSFLSDIFKNQYLEESYDMIYGMYGAEYADYMEVVMEKTILTPSFMFIMMLVSSVFTALIVGAIVAVFNKKDRVF